VSSLIRRPHAPHPDGPGAEPRTEHPAGVRRPGHRPHDSWRHGGARLLDGVVAASLGLGLCTVVVLLFWIGSPYPQSGPSGALHVAASVWLLTHGADLVRTSTVTGDPVPAELTPLLLVLLPVWLLARAVHSAVEEHRPSARAAAQAAGPVVAGYLLVGGLVTAYAAGGPVHVEPLAAGLRLSLFTTAVTAAATWTALGRPRPRPPRVVRSAAPVCGAALRAAVAGTALLMGGGVVLTLTAVARHGGQVGAGLERLSGSWAGDLAVVLLTLALLPNAAVWATSYGLGPGFTVGGGSVVAPLATTGGPELPAFPLLAGLPAAGPGGPTAWAAGVVPLAAALGLGWYVGRTAAPVAAPLPRGTAVEATLGPRDTALAAALGACGCAVAMGALAVVAGGALGTAALGRFGPVWWATGAAALGWTAVLGVPTAWAVRAWRLRTWGRAAPRGLRTAGPVPRCRGAQAERAADGWHGTGARRSRWAALKKASGGLMPDFPPRGRDD
jgi:hypothetical protein